MKTRNSRLLAAILTAITLAGWIPGHADAKEKSATQTTEKSGAGKDRGKNGGTTSPDMLTELEASDLAEAALASLESVTSTPEKLTVAVEDKIKEIKRARTGGVAASTQPSTQPAKPLMAKGLAHGQLVNLGRTIDTKIVGGVRGAALEDAIRTQVKMMRDAQESRGEKKNAAGAGKVKGERKNSSTAKPPKI